MLKTILYEEHRLLKAKMVDFAGWEMPIQYSNLIEEHLCVRNKVGLFDVSHMGTFRISGENAFVFLQKMIPNDLSKIPIGKAVYTQFCLPTGGTIDDLIIYHTGENSYHLVVNASNIEKDFQWLKEHLTESSVELENLSEKSCILALQGPLAEKTLNSICEADLTSLGSFCLVNTKINDLPAIVSRTGYTGEDGFEIIFENVYAVQLWQKIMQAGAEYEIRPIGLGARDTLRLEATLPLYGHELDENTSPLEARLGWSVKLEKEFFVGKEALIEQKKNGGKKKQIGLKSLSRIVPREGYNVFDQNNQLIGKVTSGTFAPLLNYPIALTYINNETTYIPGDLLQVEIRGNMHQFEIVKLPFYKRNRSN